MRRLLLLGLVLAFCVLAGCGGNTTQSIPQNPATPGRLPPPPPPK